jgi:hypothetical protein
MVGSAETSQVPKPATVSHRSTRMRAILSAVRVIAPMPKVMVRVRDLRHMRGQE